MRPRQAAEVGAAAHAGRRHHAGAAAAAAEEGGLLLLGLSAVGRHVPLTRRPASALQRDAPAAGVGQRCGGTGWQILLRGLISGEQQRRGASSNGAGTRSTASPAVYPPVANGQHKTPQLQLPLWACRGSGQTVRFWMECHAVVGGVTVVECTIRGSACKLV